MKRFFLKQNKGVGLTQGGSFKRFGSELQDRKNGNTHKKNNPPLAGNVVVGVIMSQRSHWSHDSSPSSFSYLIISDAKGNGLRRRRWIQYLRAGNWSMQIARAPYFKTHFQVFFFWCVGWGFFKNWFSLLALSHYGGGEEEKSLLSCSYFALLCELL